MNKRALAALLGIYLTGGGVYTFVTRSWFPVFPLQFDIFRFFPGGLYVAAGLALILGVFFLVASALPDRKRTKVGKAEET